MTIEERLNFLKEAEDFFKDLSAAGENNYRLGKFKSAALATVRECLDIYKAKALEGADWTEETLDEGLSSAIDENYIEAMVETHGIEGEDEVFYKGGFGLAIGILQGDEESVNGLKELKEQYNHLLELKM